jgi:hypothetical protein
MFFLSLKTTLFLTWKLGKQLSFRKISDFAAFSHYCRTEGAAAKTGKEKSISGIRLKSSLEGKPFSRTF